MPNVKEEYVQSLKFMSSTADAVTRTMAGTRNRIAALAKSKNARNDEIVKMLKSLKDKIEYRMTPDLQMFDLYTHWLEKVPGVGNSTAAKLLLHYYYRMVPYCPDCGTDLEKRDKTMWCNTCKRSAAGDGLLTYRIEEKDFPRISGWWKYMGRHNTAHCPTCRKGLDENGKCPKCKKIIENPAFLMPMREKGNVCDWSTKGRTAVFALKGSFNRIKSSDQLYRDHHSKEKIRYQKLHPDWTKSHIENTTWNNTLKLFLSHMWQVARTLDGKPVTKPYICQKNPAHNIILPYYFDQPIAQAADDIELAEAA